MNAIRWIPVVEQQPGERVVVIVGQDSIRGGFRSFAGWIEGDCWYSYLPNPYAECDPGCPALVAEMGDVRATDFWLPIPTEHPQHNVVDGGYPA